MQTAKKLFVDIRWNGIFSFFKQLESNNKR